ncbi:MAG: hypothetical protein QOI35_2435 [Cryptosporangiaceae bacterium]|jgi:hypothetical protein|nr:hypothetical protein [Cryptosporangiaceae bacterium]
MRPRTVIVTTAATALVAIPAIAIPAFAHASTAGPSTAGRDTVSTQGTTTGETSRVDCDGPGVDLLIQSSNGNDYCFGGHGSVSFGTATALVFPKPTICYTVILADTRGNDTQQPGGQGQFVAYRRAHTGTAYLDPATANGCN